MRIINIYSMNGEIFFYKTKTKKIDAQVMEQRGRCHVYATYSDFMQTVFPHAVMLHASQIITPYGVVLLLDDTYLEKMKLMLLKLCLYRMALLTNKIN